jgi:hypothetical protein
MTWTVDAAANAMAKAGIVRIGRRVAIRNQNACNRRSPTPSGQRRDHDEHRGGEKLQREGHCPILVRAKFIWATFIWASG